MKDVFKLFNNVAEFYAYINGGTTQKHFQGHEASLVEREDGGWNGTKDFTTAQQLLVHGDKENADKIEKGGVAKERLKVKLTENRRRLFSNVTGVAVNVPNYIAGVPAAMIDARIQRTKTKVLNVVYNVSVNGGVSADELRNTAIKMLSAIMRVEAAGVRVNLYVTDISIGRRGHSIQQKIGWLLRIKSSGQHLDVLKTAYPLTNPAMLRRHSFRFTEITKGVSSAFVDGYGGANQDAGIIMQTFGLRNYVQLHYSTINKKSVSEITQQILDGAK